LHLLILPQQKSQAESWHPNPDFPVRIKIKFNKHFNATFLTLSFDEKNLLDSSSGPKRIDSQ
jgi:hypothetical protein